MILYYNSMIDVNLALYTFATSSPTPLQVASPPAADRNDGRREMAGFGDLIDRGAKKILVWK